MLYRKLIRDLFVRRARLVGALALATATGCASLDFSPSTVETWSGPPFPVERVATIEVLPVATVRAIDRGSSIVTAQAAREAATSLLREKGYIPTASGDAVAMTASSTSAAAVLDVTAIADRCPSADGFVLALAVEEIEPDRVVAPATFRIALRGVIVDVADRVVVWSGASVAEAGSPSGAFAVSPSASVYSAIYQAMRALLADVPLRPIELSIRHRDAEWAESGSAHPRRAIDGGVRRSGEDRFAAGRGAEERRCGDEGRCCGLEGVAVVGGRGAGVLLGVSRP